MVIRITWGKLRSGAWGDFERTYRENVLTKGKSLKGLRGRWLAQDAADKDTGFAVSLWDNPADMQAYEQSPLYREIMAPLPDRSGLSIPGNQRHAEGRGRRRVHLSSE